jgi:hypothetical protein
METQVLFSAQLVAKEHFILSMFKMLIIFKIILEQVMEWSTIEVTL